MTMDKITIELTSEELLEARFCVKRYSEYYPNYPNEHLHSVRESFVMKMTDAFVEWQENYNPELEDDNS